MARDPDPRARDPDPRARDPDPRARDQGALFRSRDFHSEPGTLIQVLDFH